MYFTLQPVKMPQSVATENREQHGLDSGTACAERYRLDCDERGGGGAAPDRSPCSPTNRQQAQRLPPSYGKTGRACLCAGCGGPIEDRYYLLAADQQWHTDCLRCCECKIALDNELTCFAKDGGIYCKEHYFRRFGVKKCGRCGTGIAAHEMVMRARSLVYHLTCFTCAMCSMALTTGDYFGMRDAQVYCRLHYETAVLASPEHTRHQGEHQPLPSSQQQQQSQQQHHPGLAPGYQGPLTPGPSPPCAPSGPVGFYNGMGVGVHKGRPRKRKGLDSVGDYCRGLGSVDGHLGLDGDGYVTQQSQRTKRMRTSFKHHQLRTMKSYFSLNHNPDAKDLKQLAQKTGLTKRVLQVWFQNARAKYRRSLLKKEQGGGDKSVGSPSGQGELMPGNSVSSPSTNGRSSPTSTTGGVPSLHGGCDTSSGSEQGSVIMGSPVGDDGSGSYTSEGLSYSELKNASELSPAVADEVLTISAMPARSPNHTLAGDCLPSPNALNGSVLKTNLVDIFN
ncbi:LIM/homeobox protein Lhx9-like [Acanthaster planci]|uniref:LIM/homeobox protein Lhx9-like n=1 Tax=Acanthaster planci TaxID=133434 RepID=A0A8B7XW25_ACAPL|nr:LIM/homeobox protein Lhx9-like [Acanthaster planci]